MDVCYDKLAAVMENGWMDYYLQHLKLIAVGVFAFLLLRLKARCCLAPASHTAGFCYYVTDCSNATVWIKSPISNLLWALWGVFVFCTSHKTFGHQCAHLLVSWTGCSGRPHHCLDPIVQKPFFVPPRCCHLLFKSFFVLVLPTVLTFPDTLLNFLYIFFRYVHFSSISLVLNFILPSAPCWKTSSTSKTPPLNTAALASYFAPDVIYLITFVNHLQHDPQQNAPSVSMSTLYQAMKAVNMQTLLCLISIMIV